MKSNVESKSTTATLNIASLVVSITPSTTHSWALCETCSRPAKLTAAEAITLIHEAGGLAVIAHPGLYHRDEVIPPLVDAGLDGIECFYTRHSTSMTENYLMLAEEHGLLVTGGSDCHGDNKGKPLIGCVKLPYEFLARMKSAVLA